jgi:hypothetical protein
MQIFCCAFERQSIRGIHRDGNTEETLNPDIRLFTPQAFSLLRASLRNMPALLHFRCCLCRRERNRVTYITSMDIHWYLWLLSTKVCHDLRFLLAYIFSECSNSVFLCWQSKCNDLATFEKQFNKWIHENHSNQISWFAWCIHQSDVLESGIRSI